MRAKISSVEVKGMKRKYLNYLSEQSGVKQKRPPRARVKKRAADATTKFTNFLLRQKEWVSPAELPLDKEEYKIYMPYLPESTRGAAEKIEADTRALPLTDRLLIADAEFNFLSPEERGNTGTFFMESSHRRTWSSRKGSTRAVCGQGASPYPGKNLKT